jgi:hypothetical protein
MDNSNNENEKLLRAIGLADNVVISSLNSKKTIKKIKEVL